MSGCLIDSVLKAFGVVVSRSFLAIGNLTLRHKAA